MNPSQILIAEDESIVAMDIQEALKGAQYTVLGVAGSGRDAVEKASRTRPDLVLMDIRLKGDMDGVQAAREIREQFDIPVVYLTAYSDEKTLQRAKMTEPYGYLLKPFEKEDLQSSIEMALYKHRMEKAVKESRRWLEAILRSTGDAVIATDARGFITFMNPVAEKLTGRSATWATGPHWTEVMPLRDGSGDSPRELTDAFERGESAEFPLDTIMETGDQPRPVDGVLTPARDEKGRLAGFVLAFRDVTARRRLEDELKRANQVLGQRVLERTETLNETNKELQRHVKEVDALYKYAPCGYHSLDRQGRVIRMNQTELNWLGLKPPEVIGRLSFLDLLSPSSRPLFEENMAVFRERGWLRDVEYEMIGRGGVPFPVLLNASGVKEDGGFVMDRVTVHNMTERRKAERTLMESEFKFRCIAESAAEGILQTDEKGNVVYANRAAQTLFGCSEEEMVGRPARALVPAHHRDKFKEIVRSLASLEPGTSTGALTGLRGLDASGREFPVEASVACWSAGGRRNYAAMLRDVSERRRLEAALLHAGKLSAMGQMAAGLAHELKTPLGTIFSFSDVLLSKIKDPNAVPTLETIRRQALRCAGLIDQLLDFARRHKTSETETADMVDVVESALSLVESHTKTRGVMVTRDLAARPLPVRAPKNMLEQVLVNLCMNAVDAMPEGGTLTIQAAAADVAGVPSARIEVTDTGTGIPAEIRDRLFEPFQTSKAPGRGTGLGLWLTREMLSGMGGAIAFRSAEGRGTTFTVTIPLAPDAEGGAT